MKSNLFFCTGCGAYNEVVADAVGNKTCPDCGSCVDSSGNILQGSDYPAVPVPICPQCEISLMVDGICSGGCSALVQPPLLSTENAVAPENSNASFFCNECGSMTLERKGAKLKCSECGQVVEAPEISSGQIEVEGYAVASPS